MTGMTVLLTFGDHFLYGLGLVWGAPGEVHHTMLPRGSNPNPSLLILNPTKLNP